MPENSPNPLETARLRLGVNKKDMAALLRITPEWYSRVINGPGLVSEDLLLRLGQVLRDRGLEEGSSVREESGAAYGRPAVRSDCETYFRARCDEAQESADPNAWPYMLMLLRQALPPGFIPRARQPRPQYPPQVEALLKRIEASRSDPELLERLEQELERMLPDVDTGTESTRPARQA